ncbi:carbohydrate ABC transporter membrane protein 2, CUT1 family (TC 3.A.1.1.-) [Rhizobium sp. NFR07]|uniref:carbohydrate ABC transporter permease n=1 Tax=Rhizobium sp. NFR07 TaxID=1566262 RepID=UPI0008EA1537|nr:carbohydrate ABC transporter permease [Rhizobium sp. NFR07]SFB43482.1 carbohydrate ABC transporter membrane protein 2, CUT1 family (TC 3.A.1.1.-) [Rhizobium sp. NFR07]
MRRRSSSSLVSSIASHAVLMLGALVMLLPFLWMALTSLKPPQEIFRFGLHILPEQWGGAENYGRVFSDTPMLRFLVNGIVVCSAIVVLQVLIAVPAAYALARIPFRGRSLFFSLILISLLVPIQVPSLFLYLGFAHAGLLDTYASLVLPFIISAFAIFLLRQHFLHFPQEVIEAARLDNFGEFEIAWRIVLPSARPAIGAFAVFSMVAHWNDLYWPLVVVTDPAMATPPLGVVFFRNQESGSDFGALMAAATVISAPLILAFLLAQRTFVRGLTSIR